METTVYFILGLTCVVNGGHLVEPLDWHNCSIAREGILFAMDALGSGSSSFRALPQCHCPVHLSVLLENEVHV